MENVAIALRCNNSTLDLFQDESDPHLYGVEYGSHDKDHRGTILPVAKYLTADLPLASELDDHESAHVVVTYTTR